ncbi:ABC transporter ATP-binding protein [Pseudomonas sp. BIOMIG1BAC]|nr:ABC transporter ATP-binding protein [Pseudomonas sp. BIOMIG1BAC]
MLIDEGVLGRDFSRLLQVAIAMVLVGIFGVLLGGASRYLHTRLSGRILFNLRDSLYSHLQRAVAGAECNTVIELKLEHHAA